MHTYTDTCTHSNQGWEQERGHWHTHMEPDRETLFFTKQCKEWSSHGNQVDMYTCSDTCIHSNQDEGLEEGGWDMQKEQHRVEHVCMQLCK